MAGTVLAPDDAAQARRLLRAKLGPTSRHWTRLQDSTKRFAAARAAFQIGRVAYPRAWSDSVLTFLREAGTRHPDPAVRAEFLFGGLQVAAAERGETQDQFYRRLTDGHEDAHYATKARRLFDPENLFGGLSMACGFADLVQNGFCTRPVAPLQGSFGLRSCTLPAVSRLNIHPPNRF